MQIVITQVQITEINTGKTPYKRADVSYTSNGRPQTFKVMSFSSPAVFAVLSKASPGEAFNVAISKNAAGYNQWDSITPASAVKPAQAASVSSATRSSYETPEERADRQRLIVRQSSLTAAINTLTPGAKTVLDFQQVVTLAEEYASWVFEPPQAFNEGPWPAE